MISDEFFMKRAIKLAKKGERWVSPNPMVGAVIVKKGRIISEGYHIHCGENHAEINAIDAARESIKGSTFYVSLEPCVHWGHTPPCIAALIAQRPARVVIGTTDPNPLVAGRGIEELKRHGIKTTVGVLADECGVLNERFFKYMRTGMPFITLKFAQTLDGRIATTTGHSQWISSAQSLRFAHHLRSIHDAVLVGAGTVVTDDPELTARLVKGRNPLRIIADGKFNIPLTSKILKNQEQARTLVAITKSTGRRVLTHLDKMGIETILIPETANHLVNLKQLFKTLGDMGVSSVLVEGGSSIITSLLKDGLVDRLVVIVAPKLIGRGVEAVADLGIRMISEALAFKVGRIFHSGEDIIYDGRIVYPS
jgi:diaminohydroxyphosphoribosylaminopyrimidine deaminase/5-amino-6-(5-phosphoribosylamino)uracil reductase